MVIARRLGNPFGGGGVRRPPPRGRPRRPQFLSIGVFVTGRAAGRRAAGGRLAGGLRRCSFSNAVFAAPCHWRKREHEIPHAKRRGTGGPTTAARAESSIGCSPMLGTQHPLCLSVDLKWAKSSLTRTGGLTHEFRENETTHNVVTRRLV